jgi:AcrR family transcriptional regulator
VSTERRRGRPRNQAARATILAAARALLDEGGIAAVTIEELAARTGVSKPTIYRSWPNAQAVAMAALSVMQTDVVPAVSRRSTALDLKRVLRGVVTAFASRAGRSAAALIASADPETEIAKAFRHHVILKCREQIRDIVMRGIGDGVIRDDVEIDIALDLVLSPVFFRLLLGHGPLDDAFADAVVEQAMTGLRARKPGARRTSRRPRAASP